MDYKRRYAALTREPLEKASQENISAVRALIDELLRDGGAEAKATLWLAYQWLGRYQSAYDLCREIADPKDRKAQLNLVKLKQLADEYGDGRKPGPSAAEIAEIAAQLPKFKYQPCCAENEIFTRAKPGRPAVCQCCGRETLWYYESMYCEKEIGCLCPDCISSGAAAEKFDGDFVQDAEPLENGAEKTEELFKRTPGYTSLAGRMPACLLQ